MPPKPSVQNLQSLNVLNVRDTFILDQPAVDTSAIPEPTDVDR